ncbi:MAG TPA: AAA family ATPase [Euzebyales bacterium]|nr:AAA family ATPase [Euzebyales bacterium]
MTVRLLLLGAPTVERDGAPVSFDTRKAMAVLAYLAVTGRAHRRETLAAIGWPDVERERAAAALRRTLSTIRTSAGPDVLVTEGDTIALHPAAVWVDVVTARAALAETRTHGHAATRTCPACVAPLRTAVDLHRGPFLEGFNLRDSPEFEEWHLLTTEALQRELGDALSSLTSAHVRAGDLGEAILAARRRLELDPLHEPTHRALMRLYAWKGDRSAALRQYRACVRALETDLGVTPLSETTQVYEAIVSDRLPRAPAPGAVGRDDEPAAPPGSPTHPAPAPATAAPPAPADAGPRRARKLTPAATAPRPDDTAPTGDAATTGAEDDAAAATIPRPGTPFVARDRELAVVTDVVAAAGDRGTLIAIEGEAGIGKTRLLAELLAGPRLRDRRVLRIACQQDEAGLALGAVMEALQTAPAGDAAEDWRALLPAHALREVARVLPELADAGDPPPATDPAAAWRLRDALAGALVAAVSPAGAAAGPGLLVIDDAHWMDESSLDVLAHLARRLDRHPACVLVTWRSELIDRGHRLRRLVADLSRSDLARTITLERLDGAAVHELLRHTLDADHDELGELTARVMTSTEGVPLLVVEYLAALAVDPAALDGPAPRGAADLFHARLAAVGDTARQILTTAAVIGRSFDPDLVRRVSGRSEEETTTALEELFASGLINELAGGRAGYDFSHARLRAVVYDDAGLARRRLLHRRAAAALERRVRHVAPPDPSAPQRAAGADAPAAAIAAHHRAAGDAEQAAQWSVRAAQRATALLAVTDAIDHYTEALALGYPDPRPVHESLGDLHTLAGRYGDALRHFEAAAALAGEDRFAALEHKIAGVHIRRGQWVLAAQHLHVALTVLGDDDGPDTAALRARILTDQGLVAHRQGDDTDAAELATAALTAAEAAGDLAALAGAHNLLGVLSKQDLSLARHHLEHALALARRLHDVATEVAAANNLAQAHAAAGAVARALPLAESALARSAQLGDRHRQAALHNNLADLLRASGRDDEAMAQLKQAVRLFAEVDEQAVPEAEVWKLAEW